MIPPRSAERGKKTCLWGQEAKGTEGFSKAFGKTKSCVFMCSVMLTRLKLVFSAAIDLLASSML